MAVYIEDHLPVVKYEGLNTQKNVSVSGSSTFTGNVTLSAGITGDTDDLTAASTLTSASSGKTLLLNSATEFATTLPAPASGLKFRFIVKAAPSGASYTVATADGDDIIQGQATVNGAAVAAVDEDTITFTDGAAAVGDWVELISDGTNWYVSGQGVAATAIAFTAT